MSRIPGRLREDAFELDKNGILTIRLVIDLTTTTDILDEPEASLSIVAVRAGLPLSLFRRDVRFHADRTARRHCRKEGLGSTFGFR